jgi:hypothetical protein
LRKPHQPCSINTTMSPWIIELLAFMATIVVPAAWLLWENRS